MGKDPCLHIVLLEPDIPQNTGNIGRSCVALGAPLHIVGQPGFSLTGKDIKRAGLDYWPKLALEQHLDWPSFLKTTPEDAFFFFLSTRGERSLWQTEFHSPCYLVFGSESRGFPPSFYDTYRDRLLRIPMEPGVRSLNLATAVGIAAYEAARQLEKEGVKSDI